MLLEMSVYTIWVNNDDVFELTLDAERWVNACYENER